MLKIIFLANLLYASENLPSWIENPINSDEKYYYGFGIAENKSESQAYKDADNEANFDLIQTAFGASYEYKSEENSNDKEIKLKKYVFSGTDQIYTNFFEKIKTFKVKDKENFKVYVLKRIAKDKTSLITNEQKGKIVTVKFDSDPEGADIYLDNKYLGKTPLNSVVVPKKYQIKFELKGYKAILQNEIIKSGNDFNFHVQLEKEIGFLSVKTEISEYKIYINDIEQSVSDTTYTLAPGKYELKIISDGYKDFETQIDIKPQKNVKIVANLVKTNSNKIDVIAGLSDTKNEEKAAELYRDKKYSELLEFIEVTKMRKDIKIMFHAFALTDLGNFPKAIGMYKKLTKTDTHFYIYQKYCAALIGLGRYNEGFAICRKSIDLNPTNIGAYLLIGRTHFALALESYDKAKVHTPIAVSAYKSILKLDSNFKQELRHYCSFGNTSMQTSCVLSKY